MVNGLIRLLNLYFTPEGVPKMSIIAWISGCLLYEPAERGLCRFFYCQL